MPADLESHSRGLTNKINRLHERCLRIIYNDKTSSFQELLQKDKSLTILERNIQKLAAIELYNVKNGLSPELMSETFLLRTLNKELRSGPIFQSRNVKIVRYATESLTYLAPKIWSILPNDIKEAKSIETFKDKIKRWSPESCPCHLCKTYV